MKKYFLLLILFAWVFSFELTDKEITLNWRDPEKAAHLSMVWPGNGQKYAGDTELGNKYNYGFPLLVVIGAVYKTLPVETKYDDELNNRNSYSNYLNSYIGDFALNTAAAFYLLNIADAQKKADNYNQAANLEKVDKWEAVKRTAIWPAWGMDYIGYAPLGSGFWYGSLLTVSSYNNNKHFIARNDTDDTKDITNDFSKILLPSAYISLVVYSYFYAEEYNNYIDNLNKQKVENNSANKFVSLQPFIAYDRIGLSCRF